MPLAAAAATPELAAQSGLPLDPQAAIVLERAAGRLQLRDTRKGAPGPLYVDFASAEADARRRAGRGLLLARACSIKPRQRPSIVDATGGLGRDAHALAALGCTVTVIERNPAIFALLQDGVRRAGENGDAAVGMITLVNADAAHWLKHRSASVVYLDPMFPDIGRTALAGKEMQYFQALLDQAGDEHALWLAAMASGARRVVVKRPKLAPAIDPGRKVDVVFRANSVRFDVYLP